MDFITSESALKPNPVDRISAERWLVRKNIRSVIRTGTDGSETTIWLCDEAVMTDAQYAAYLAAENINIRHEQDIVDDYTLTLIDEGVL